MDDTVILSNDKEELNQHQISIEYFIQNSMKLEFSKWNINHISKPLNFLGYRITPDYKLIRKDSVVRAKSKIKKYIMRNEHKKLELFLASWYGHIKTANSYNLQLYIKKEMQNANNHTTS